MQRPNRRGRHGVKTDAQIAAQIGNDLATRTTWHDAWQMICDAVRPYPEVAQAVLVVVDRLIAECDAASD